ncbi:GFA family protein [Congregibacter variabilis]|uniref:GFA family protein n=1 Tax=Congregibacter variabilis TaxID=3081200 RepID=A0ABZ0I2U4_9GAMM|nr:GFA family protein [Congregibacter sp. IMCC43200]
MSALKTFHGGCHCSDVRFSVQAPDSVELERCNCSICSMGGYLHLIVPASRFQLLQGKEKLSCYQFNSGIAKHYFCKTCGIKPFYIPRSNPDGVDVNVNCLDEKPSQMTIVEFDGDDWEANAHTLAHKSQE